jgi:predicted ATPase
MEDLLARIAGGENERTEFQRSFASADDVLPSIVALANSQWEGRVLFGVNESGEIVGVLGAEDLARLLLKLCREECVPPVPATTEIEDTPAGRVLVLRIKGDAVAQPYGIKERPATWIRDGAVNQRVTWEEAAHIIEARHRIAFPLLRHLRFERFRSLFDTELDLKPLNIIIGPNASGKSNLFKGLDFLRDIVVEKEWRRYEAAGRHLFWYGGPPDRLSIEISAELPEQRGSFPPEYRLAIGLEGEHLTMLSETLTLKRSPADSEPVNFIQRTGGRANFYRDAGAPSPSSRTVLPQVIALREVAGDIGFAPAAGLLRFIEGWRLLMVDANAARASTGRSERLEPLAEDGSNLSAVLYALSQQKPPDLFEEIQDRLGRAIGFPAALEAPVSPSLTGGPARISIAFREHAFPDLPDPIPAESMSDGTIRLLAILTALIGDPAATLICVEEPDHGLHPHLMLRLADAIRSVVRVEPDPDTRPVRRPQVILTTHNPELLNCFNLIEEKDYLRVFVAERDPLEGRTTFTAVDADALAHWLRDYRLGDLVNMGVVR